MGDASVWKWSIAGILAVLTGLAVTGLVMPPDPMLALVRGSLLVATLVLISEEAGGASGSFAAWYGAVALLYPITLPRRYAQVVPIVVPGAYLAVALLGSNSIPATQALTRAGMLLGVALVALLLGRSAIFMSEQVNQVRSRLREAEGMLDAAFATAQTGMAVLDLGGRIVEVNQAMCDLIGAPRSSVITSSWVRVVHPDDLRKQASKIEQLIKGDAWSFQAETRFRSRDGRLAWGMLGISTIADDVGRPKYLFAHVMNITDRVRTERKLKESELHFRTLFDLAPVPVWEMDLTSMVDHLGSRALPTDGAVPTELLEEIAGSVSVVSVNEAARALFEARDDQDFAVAVAAGRLGPDVVRAIVGLIATVREGTHRYQLAVSLSDLKRRVHQGGLRVIVPKVDGKPAWGHATAAFVDDTGLMRAESALKQVENRLGTVVNAAPLLLWGVDSTGVFTLLEGQGAAGLGLDGIQAVGRSAFEVFRDSPTIPGNLRRALKGETFTTVDRAGDRIFECRYVPDIDDQAVSGVVGVAYDVTDRTLAADRLRGLVKSKDRFVATVSHELRTPLTAVVGFADELRSGLDTLQSEDIRMYVDLIAGQAGEVADLVEDLLVASRMGDDEVPISNGASDFWEQVDSVLVARRLENPVATDRSSGQAKVFADPVRVRQVVRNLLTNADRYGGTGVEVTIARVGEMYALSVSDDGPGVVDEERQMIFEPYHRGHVEDGRAESVGLGLAVSRHLARRMDGDLTYVRHNNRSVFTLTLPAA
ncbi:PAS domain S-box protein [bacterium]|nr:PAS domain S-box protein [bacterium]